jgi:hypothetical protein
VAQLQEMGKFGSDVSFTFQIDKGWESLKMCLNHSATEKVRQHKIIFPKLFFSGWWEKKCRRDCQYAVDSLVWLFYFKHSSK